eukprot:305467_1
MSDLLNKTVTASVLLYSTFKLWKVFNSDNSDVDIQSAIHIASLSKLPNDLLQHILSYLPYSSSNKLVNKSFRRLSEANLQIELFRAKQLRMTQAEICSISDLDTRFGGQVWIMDPKRTHLSEYELQKGYKGPLTHILSAVIDCNDGDRVFISQGLYEFDAYFPWQHTKSIMFIGIGKVTIKNLPRSFLRNTHFENIHFEFDAVYDTYLIDSYDQNHHMCMHAAQLSFKRCVWNVMQTLHCTGNVHFEDCVFIHTDSEYLDEGFISLTPWCANAVIIGCRFSNFRSYGFLNGTDSCVYIAQNDFKYLLQFEQRHGTKERKKIKLIMIGNIFENNTSYPIVYERFSSIRLDYESLLVKHNVLKGFNVLEPGTNEYVNPNKLYRERDECANSDEKQPNGLALRSLMYRLATKWLHL